MAVRGVDVSQADGSIDWNKVKAAGYQFAICKATEGDWVDPTFGAGRIGAIRKAGLIPGAYVYLRPRPGRSGADEVRIFWEKAREAGLYSFTDGTIDVRPVLDIEESAFDCSTIKGRWQTRRYIKSAVREILRLSKGRHPIIYTGKFWREDLQDWKDNSDCLLWYPEYGVARPIQVPAAWGKVAIWQNSESATVPGIQSLVDTNIYMLGDWAHFKRKCCV